MMALQFPNEFQIERSINLVELPLSKTEAKSTKIWQKF